MGRIQACEANLPIDERWEELDELCDSLEDLQEVRIHLRKEPSWSVDSEVNLRRNLRRAAASIPRIQARARRGLSLIFVVRGKERYPWDPGMEHVGEGEIDEGESVEDQGPRPQWAEVRGSWENMYTESWNESEDYTESTSLEEYANSYSSDSRL